MPRLLLILQSLCNAQNLLEGHSLSELSPSLCVIGANASPAKIAFPQLCRWPSTRSVSHCKWSFPWYLAASQWRNAGPSFCICLLSTMIAYCWRKTQMQSKYMWQHRLHSVSSPHIIHQYHSQRNSVLTLRANRCVLVLGGHWLTVAAVASWVRDLNKVQS